MVDIYVKIETGVNSTFTLLTALTHIDAAVIALTIQTEVKVMVMHEYQYWEKWRKALSLIHGNCTEYLHSRLLFM